MAEALKHFFDARLVRTIAGDLARVAPAFSRAAFVKDCLDGLEDAELLARARKIADAMHRHLPAPFAVAGRLVLDAVAAPSERTDERAMAPFYFMPHTLFVQHHGLDDFELSMKLQYELTQRFSAEASIRPYLLRHPERTLARLAKWARDPNVHVRRLVSEGTRPRLPWAMRLAPFVADPAPVIALLELLKHDPERYVQRSVANNLNDIAKDHPETVVALCRSWAKDPGPGTAYIVRHALRTLIKKGHRGALAAVGAGAAPRIRVRSLAVPPRARIGEKLRITLSLVSTARRAQELEVDYAVHFVKADGETRPKTFKLRRVSLPAGDQVDLSATLSLAQHTTRKHHPGKHRVEILVNGLKVDERPFLLAR